MAATAAAPSHATSAARTPQPRRTCVSTGWGLASVRGLCYPDRPGLWAVSSPHTPTRVSRVPARAGCGDARDDHDHPRGLRPCLNASWQRRPPMAAESSPLGLPLPPCPLLVDASGGAVVVDAPTSTFSHRRLCVEGGAPNPHRAVQRRMEPGRPPVQLVHEVGREDHG